MRRQLFMRKTGFFCLYMRWIVRLWGREGLSSCNNSSEIFLIVCFDFIEKMQFLIWWRHVWSGNVEEPFGMCLWEYFACYWWRGLLILSMGILLSFQAEAQAAFAQSSFKGVAFNCLWCKITGKSSQCFGQCCHHASSLLFQSQRQSWRLSGFDYNSEWRLMDETLVNASGRLANSPYLPVLYSRQQ